MFCQKCGASVSEEASFCRSCGATLENPNNQKVYNNVDSYNPPKSTDVPNTGINILACCFPILGLILYLVWKEERQISAKSVGKWALIGLVVGVFLWIIYAIIMIFVMSSYIR